MLNFWLHELLSTGCFCIWHRSVGSYRPFSCWDLLSSKNPDGLIMKPSHFLQIMDDPKYSFMTWPRICLDETPEMVVMVLTAPKNFDSRSKIRETLYEFNVNSTNKVKPLFLIGGSGGGLDTLQVWSLAPQCLELPFFTIATVQLLEKVFFWNTPSCQHQK